MNDSFDAPDSRRSPKVAIALSIVWILFLSGIAFFNRLGSIGLVDETEPLFVEAARQMTVTGNWITPYFNQVTRFDKPPLIYWLMAIGFQALGVNEWTARLPSAIAGTLLVGFCFYTLRRLSGARSAYMGSAILALNLMMLFFGRLGYSDMLLNLCFGGSLLAFFLGYVGQGDCWYLAFYALMGLAVLTKGPVGVVLPSAIVLIFLAWSGNLREVLREMKPILGAVIFLLISVPWYVLIYLENGNAFINSFFGLHNVERFTSVVNQHSGAWYYHSAIVLIGFFPWSLCLPAAVASLPGGFAQVVTGSKWRQRSRSEHLGWFALIWFSVVLGFFTIAVTKYLTYTLPLFPAAAILVALWWQSQFSQSRQSRWLKFTVYFSIAIAIALAVCIFYSPNWLNADPSMPNLGGRMQQAGLQIIGAAIWFGAAIAGVGLALRYQFRWYWIVNLVAIAAFIVFFVTPAIGMIDSVRQLPLRQIAEATIQNKQPDEAIVMATNRFEKPSLVFYTREPITFINRANRIEPYLSQLQQTKARSILMITTESTIGEGNVQPNQYQLLQQNGSYQLLRVPIAPLPK